MFLAFFGPRGGRGSLFGGWAAGFSGGWRMGDEVDDLYGTRFGEDGLGIESEEFQH